MRTLSIEARRFSRSLGFFTLAALARTFSSVPYSLSRLAAVFSPTPGTPGMLSILSPVSASRSPTWRGGTPHFSSTSLGPYHFSYMESYERRESSTSCIRSLSPVTMTTSQPCARARRASVAMTSSAS